MLRSENSRQLRGCHQGSGSLQVYLKLLTTLLSLRGI